MCGKRHWEATEQKLPLAQIQTMSALFTKAQMYLQEPGHLNEPADIIRVHAVFNGPLGQLIPFVPGAAVDGQT